MTLKADTRIYKFGENKQMLYIPKGVHEDSAFPFTGEDTLEIRVVGDELRIKKKV